MLHESMDHVGQDSEAVSAVRGGDVERCRELVERHERRVFAVAWSRLGDAALNRVKDLERWQFRPQRRGVAKGQLAWNDVEAWVCQQRLEKLLRARKENPQAAVRSLLQE
jgi:hypothetical protein